MPFLPFFVLTLPDPLALTDPSFAKVALELSKEGAAKLGIA